MIQLVINSIEVSKIIVKYNPYSSYYISYKLPYITMMGLSVLLNKCDIFCKDTCIIITMTQESDINMITNIDKYLQSKILNYIPINNKNKIYIRNNPKTFSIYTDYLKHNKDKLILSITSILKQNNNTYKPLLHIYG